MRTFDRRSYSSFKHKWGYHFYIKHCCVHTIRVAFAQFFLEQSSPRCEIPPKRDELTLGFVDDDFM